MLDELLELINQELEEVNTTLDRNPLNAVANARYKELKSVLDELEGEF